MALCKARISVQPLWGFSSSNPHHSQSRAEQTVSNFLIFYPLKEVARPLQELKKILQKYLQRVSKEAEFCHDFKKVQQSWTLEFSKRRKNFYRKADFFRTSVFFRISRPNENHSKQSDLGESLDPIAKLPPPPVPHLCDRLTLLLLFAETVDNCRNDSLHPVLSVL